MSEKKLRIVVATMKDEGPYILEWLAYHHIIGFDHFIVFSNDCWDTTAEILRTVSDELGIVSYFENSGQHGLEKSENKDPQRRAYERAICNPRAQSADYVLVLDADEFLNIHVGLGTLDDLVAAAPKFEAMSLTWKLFGSNHVTEIKDDLVMSQFTKCLTVDRSTASRKMGVKTLFHPRRVKKFGVHRPFYDAAIKEGHSSIRWLNGSGEDVFDYYRDLAWHATNENHGSELAEINHYAVKSIGAFLNKMRRGSANSHNGDRISLEYLQYYDHNETVDTSIQRHEGTVKKVLNGWFLRSPKLAALHSEAVEIHRKIAEEMTQILVMEDLRYLEEFGLTLEN